MPALLTALALALEAGEEATSSKPGPSQSHITPDGAGPIPKPQQSPNSWRVQWGVGGERH